MPFVSALELLRDPDRFKSDRKAEPGPDLDAIADGIAVDFPILPPRAHRGRPMPSRDYMELRARQLAGEKGVFFEERAEPAGGRPDPGDALEAVPVLPPRIRRRVDAG